jgi:hypothetical protein
MPSEYTDACSALGLRSLKPPRKKYGTDPHFGGPGKFEEPFSARFCSAERLARTDRPTDTRLHPSAAWEGKARPGVHF